MQHILKIITTTFLTLFSCILSAQVDSSIISVTRDYAKHLDSINRLDRPQNVGFMTSIADGITKRDNVTIGGFGIYTLSNSKGDTAYRIEYHDNLDINIYKIYYFRDDKLVYATLELQDGKTNMKRIFYKEELYSGDKVILTTTVNEDKTKRYYHKTTISLYEDGLKFLSDFKKENRR